MGDEKIQDPAEPKRVDTNVEVSKNEASTDSDSSAPDSTAEVNVSVTEGSDSSDG